MRARTAIVVVTALLALGGCGDEVADPSPQPTTPTPAEPGEEGDMSTIEGTLGGDADLEGGCAWVDVGEGEARQRYEVLWPDGYAVRFTPLRLTDADGEVVAEEGDTVRLQGSPATDMVSVCQVGTIFEAEVVEAG